MTSHPSSREAEATAEKVVRKWAAEWGYTTLIGASVLVARINEAIRAARAEEREKAAKVCDARANEQRARCELYAQSGDERGESLAYCALSAVTAVAQSIRAPEDS